MRNSARRTSEAGRHYPFLSGDSRRVYVATKDFEGLEPRHEVADTDEGQLHTWSHIYMVAFSDSDLGGIDPVEQ